MMALLGESGGFFVGYVKGHRTRIWGCARPARRLAPVAVDSGIRDRARKNPREASLLVFGNVKRDNGAT
jgi:hypothetical protein